MPLNQKPKLPKSDEDLAYELRLNAFRALNRAKARATALRSFITDAGVDEVSRQGLSDALGTADRASLIAVYAEMKQLIEAGGEACPVLPDLPTTANP